MFVSQEKVTREDLTADELSEVTILEIPEEGEPIETQKENLVCDASVHWDEGWLFNLREMTADEKREDELRALREKNRFIEDCLMEISEEVWK